MIDIERIKRVMIWGAHPDDEIIGAGATAHRLAAAGADVAVVTFTCGGTAADSPMDVHNMIRARKREMREADGILGISERHILDIQSQNVYSALFNDNDLHQKLIQIIREFKPQIVFTHNSDNHRDHDAVYRAAPHAVSQAAEHIQGHLGSPWSVDLVLYYSVELDIPGSNVIVQISEKNLDAKKKALRTQVSQLRDGFIDRLETKVDCRARLAGCAMGNNMLAESFYLEPSFPVKITD